MSVQCKPYKIPANLETKVKEEAIKLFNLGVIRKSKSSFARFAYNKQKKTGKIQLVIDYRTLHILTIKGLYPFQAVIDLLRSFGHLVCFCQLDLNTGYYQIPSTRTMHTRQPLSFYLATRYI